MVFVRQARTASGATAMQIAEREDGRVSVGTATRSATGNSSTPSPPHLATTAARGVNDVNTLDLNDANAAELRGALSTWIDAARRSGGRKNARRNLRATSMDLSLVREWPENGHEVNSRGRVPSAVQSATTRLMPEIDTPREPHPVVTSGVSQAR